jgi:tetratricopeptide (TPR) repeat protein
MQDQEAGEFYRRGLEALERDQTVAALSWFEKAIEKERSPAALSFFAYCIAQQRGQYKKAVSLCLEAIKAFREGMHHESNAQIIQELERLGLRNPPVIPFLKRNNPLNKYLGIILRRLKLR